MKKIKNSLKISALSLIALTLSACGSSGVTEKKTVKNNQTTTTTTSNATVTDVGIPGQEYSFEVYGESPVIVTPEVTTDNLLQVQVKAGNSGRILQNSVPSNFSAQYGCATFKVILEIDSGSGWVKTAEKTTSPLNAAGTSGCTGGLSSQVINFSNYLLSGEKRVRFRVEAMQTDFYCILYTKCVNAIQQNGYVSSDCTWMAGQTNMSQYVCPLKSIYTVHSVTGSIKMQVNGSTLN